MRVLKNIAYIDGANLHNGIQLLDWKFDYRRFRVFLEEKYHVGHAFLFLGYIEKYQKRYAELESFGYELIFKEVVYGKDAVPKGNCDADLVVCAMQGSYENHFEKMILVSSDGDYASLITFLMKREKMERVISPYEAKRCSILLKRTGVKISYLADKRAVLEKEKAPGEDETSQGSFS